MLTPWGQSDSAAEVAPGIQWVTTPSHGGFRLSPERQREMPDYFKGETFINGGQWYEEDCDWCLVVVAFNAKYPQAFPGDYKQAFDTLRNWHPDAFARHFGVTLTPEESFKRRTPSSAVLPRPTI